MVSDKKTTFRPLKVTVTLDGTGIFYDKSEPPMLDALLEFFYARHARHQDRVGNRDDKPDTISIPVDRHRFADGSWCWKASAFMPGGPVAETTRFIRSRFRRDRIEITNGSPNLTNGVYRDYNIPVPLILCRTMVAYCVGDRRKIRRELRRELKFLGKKGSDGFGKVVDVEVDVVDEDLSMTKDGKAMRYLPDPDGWRMVRMIPPYWNSWDRVKSCEIGDKYEL